MIINKLLLSYVNMLFFFDNRWGMQGNLCIMQGICSGFVEYASAQIGQYAQIG
jgi:hypothetical protein